MMQPLVSVIITTYNRSDIVGRAIQGVLSQDYSPIELIVVDDCSTDATQQRISQDWQGKVEYIRHEKNQGVQFASNTGYALSRGKYVAFIGDILRFPSLRDFRGWSGLIPFSRQSGNAQSRGLRITKAGPDLVKATAVLNAQVARLWDPQIAAIYHKQMLELGKHYLQALCACATHLLNRVYIVLREDRPYELRDVDGTPVDKHEARRICQERYHVPDEVRRRNNHRVRKARTEELIERRHNRRRKK